MLDDPRMTVAALAAEALEAADSYEAAAALLLDAAKSDPTVYAALIGPFETPAALAAVRALGRRERAAVWSRPAEPDARVGALAGGMAATLLDFRLPSGLRLGDATRDDVNAAAHFYGEQAADMAHKARWLAAIAAKTPARKRVGDVLDAAALAKIKETTE